MRLNMHGCIDLAKNPDVAWSLCSWPKPHRCSTHHPSLQSCIPFFCVQAKFINPPRRWIVGGGAILVAIYLSFGDLSIKQRAGWHAAILLWISKIHKFCLQAPIYQHCHPGQKQMDRAKLMWKLKTALCSMKNHVTCSFCASPGQIPIHKSKVQSHSNPCPFRSRVAMSTHRSGWLEEYTPLFFLTGSCQKAPKKMCQDCKKVTASVFVFWGNLFPPLSETKKAKNLTIAGFNGALLSGFFGL